MLPTVTSCTQPPGHFVTMRTQDGHKPRLDQRVVSEAGEGTFLVIGQMRRSTFKCSQHANGSVSAHFPLLESASRIRLIDSSLVLVEAIFAFRVEATANAFCRSRSLRIFASAARSEGERPVQSIRAKRQCRNLMGLSREPVCGHVQPRR